MKNEPPTNEPPTNDLETHAIGTQGVPGNLVVLRIIWAMMLATPILFLALAYAPATNSESDYANPQALTSPSRNPAFVSGVINGSRGVAAVALTLAVVVPLVMVQMSRRSRKDFSNNPSLNETVTACVAPLIVQYALIEIVSVSGLLAALMLKIPGIIHPYAAVAAIAVAAQFPSERRLRRIYGYKKVATP